MKTIVSREEFAKAVNFGEHPVVTIDLNQEAFMDTIYHGCKVKVDFGHHRTGERFLVRGEMLYNIKENKFEVAQYGICISARFCYEDAMRHVEYAQAPIIKDGDEVVIVLHDSKERTVKAFLATAKSGSWDCSTPMTFE